MDAAAELFADRGRRWFTCGHGRSGLIAQLAAMRLMHLGFDAHLVGEATAPSVARDDGLVMISASGETPSCFTSRDWRARAAHDCRPHHRADSTLADIADAVVEIPARPSLQFARLG
jgi:6-phospho-3-hexuloisomerase